MNVFGCPKPQLQSGFCDVCFGLLFSQIYSDFQLWSKYPGTKKQSPFPPISSTQPQRGEMCRVVFWRLGQGPPGPSTGGFPSLVGLGPSSFVGATSAFPSVLPLLVVGCAVSLSAAELNFFFALFCCTAALAPRLTRSMHWFRANQAAAWGRRWVDGDGLAAVFINMAIRAVPKSRFLESSICIGGLCVSNGPCGSASCWWSTGFLSRQGWGCQTS